MTRRTRVYIASPYTLGDVAVNVKRQVDTAHQLLDMGYAPYAPLPMTHFQHIMHPRSYIEWIIIDLEWVRCCDVVLRLDGESKGADSEVAFAQEQGINVVYSVPELTRFIRPYHD
jgi:hypothetical protein